MEMLSSYVIQIQIPSFNAVIYESEYGMGVITDRANPTVRDCRIYGCVFGAAIIEGGLGRFENCQIYGNKQWSVWIETGADPVIKGCKIYDGNECGIFVTEKGRGTVVNCEIYGNAHSNMIVEEEADLGGE